MKKRKLISIGIASALFVAFLCQPVAAAAKKPAAPTSTIPALTAGQKAEKTRLNGIITAQAESAKNEQAEYAISGKTPTVKLDVTNIYQKPELPNGCEITALSTLMLYNGVFFDKSLLSSYLPQVPFKRASGQALRTGGNPYKEFCGDPTKTSDAFYCFEDPLIDAATKMAKDMGIEYKIQKLDKATESDLTEKLDSGFPVAVWTTLSMGDPVTFEPYGWVASNGAWIEPYLNLHCVVLTGYDDTYFYFADPLRGDVVARRTTFMNAYEKMGSRAMMVTK